MARLAAEAREEARDEPVVRAREPQRVVEDARLADEVGEAFLALARRDAPLSAPNVLTAPSGPARRPSHVSRSRSRGRTNSVNVLASASRTAVAPGSAKPVK